MLIICLVRRNKRAFDMGVVGQKHPGINALRVYSEQGLGAALQNGKFVPIQDFGNVPEANSR